MLVENVSLEALLEKLDGKRYYFDYNATSPLLSDVKSLLCGEELAFANPSSSHSDGRKAKRVLEECREYLYSLFSLRENDFDLFFHSGATEAVNLLVKGFAFKQKKSSFTYVKTDHSTIRAQENFLKSRGHGILPLDVNPHGDCLLERFFVSDNKQTSPCLLNWTWVNNETGVIFSLDDAVSFKEKTGSFVHVDAVQSVGKIKNWQQLRPELDAYTYSAHKFGGPKGIGFTLLKKNFPFFPFFVGGGQQNGLRPGTENVFGVQGMIRALKYVESNYNYNGQREAKDYLVEQLEETLGDGIIIVGKEAQEVNGQTICLIFKKERSDIVSTAFDLAHMSVSTGSACSSGGMAPSPVLLAMGLDETLARSAIRLSFSPYVTREEMKEYAAKILSVAVRFS